MRRNMNNWNATERIVFIPINMIWDVNGPLTLLDLELFDILVCLHQRFSFFSHGTPIKTL